MKPYYNTLLILLVGSLLTFLLGRLSTKLNLREESAKKREDRIVELERKLAVVEAEAAPIHAAFLQMAITKLTHFHTPATDKLLEKIVAPFDQTEEEIEEIRIAMEERMADPSIEIDETEKIHAKILPDLIRLAHIEAVEKEVETTNKIAIIKTPVSDLEV